MDDNNRKKDGKAKQRSNIILCIDEQSVKKTKKKKNTQISV